MIHPKTELRYIDDRIGYGVFATANLPMGTITYVKDQLEIEIAPTDYHGYAPELRETIDKYSYRDERGYRVVSWDFAKYVNHSCDCNTMSTGYGFEIAIRDISAGEQLTDEYGIFNVEGSMPLDCGCSNCRRFLREDDFDRLYPEWDARIRPALDRLTEVEQPLMPLLDHSTYRNLQDYYRNPANYRSVYCLKYHPLVLAGSSGL